MLTASDATAAQGTPPSRETLPRAAFASSPPTLTHEETPHRTSFTFSGPQSRDIGRFEPKSDRAFVRWLETIVEHRLVDSVRAQKAKKRGGDHKHVSRPAALASTIAELFDVISGEMATPSGNLARDEAIQALRVQLAVLPEEHRDAVRLYHLEGLDLDEVARQTGRTPDAIRGILYRARQKLRDGMQKSSLWLSKK